jgi:hypothetical protein
MSQNEQERIVQALREALREPTPARGEREAESAPDLWPRMRARLAEREATPPRPVWHWWFDFALAAAIPLWFWLFPQALPTFFYHL